jgi:hypothetical protein
MDEQSCCRAGWQGAGCCGFLATFELKIRRPRRVYWFSIQQPHYSPTGRRGAKFGDFGRFVPALRGHGARAH